MTLPFGGKIHVCGRQFAPAQSLALDERMANACEQRVLCFCERGIVQFRQIVRIADSRDDHIQLAFLQTLHQHLAELHLDVDANLRKALLEQRHRLRHEVGGRRDLGADHRLPGQAGFERGHFVVRVLQLRQHAACMADQHLAVPGGLDTAGMPFEQLHTHSLFQFTQQLGRPGLRHVRGVRRAQYRAMDVELNDQGQLARLQTRGVEVARRDGPRAVVRMNGGGHDVVSMYSISI